MVGPFFYEKNDCGPYSLNEVETISFINRSKDIILLGVESKIYDSCKIVKKFHCWDYVDYKLKDSDLKAVASSLDANAIKLSKVWEEEDSFKDNVYFSHYRGSVLSCDFD